MRLGTASSVDAPSFRVITQLLHDFVQPVADSGRRCRAPDRGSMAANRHLSFIDSSFNLFPLITFRVRTTNQVRRTQIVQSEDKMHDFVHEKKVFKAGWLWMYGALIA